MGSCGGDYGWVGDSLVTDWGGGSGRVVLGVLVKVGC